MKFQLKNNSYLLMLMMLLAFVGDALSAERGADRPGVGSAAAAAAGAEEIEEVEKPIFTLPPGHGVNPATLSLDGKFLATISRSIVNIWNTETNRLVATSPESIIVTRVALSPDGSRVATVSLTGLATINNVETNELIQELNNKDWVKNVVFSLDGSLVATVSEELEAKDGSLEATNVLADKVNIWNTENGELIQVLNHDDSVHNVAFNRDGGLVATVSKNGEVKIWNTKNGELIRKLCFHGHDQANSAVFSPDGNHVIALSLKSSVKIWNIETGKFKLLKTNRYRDPHRVQDAVFSPDGSLLAMLLNNGTVTVYEASTLNKVKVFHPEKQADRFLAFSPDGRFLVTVSNDGIVQVWRIRSGRLVKPAIAKKSIKDTSEGKFLQSQITAALSKDGAQQIKDNYENLKKAIENNEVESEMPKAFDDLYNKALQFLEEC